MTRSQQRFATASAAILVQILLVMLFIHSVMPGKPRQMAREMMTMLRPIFRPVPPMRAPEQPLPRMIVPPAAVASPAPGDRAMNVAPAPPITLEGIGRALFGCAPERYADLPPDERARCPKPGEGMAGNQAPDLMGGPSHVKDNSRWANAMAHRQTVRMLPGGLFFPLVALGAVLDGSITEPNSAFRDPEQWPNERDPRQFMPRSLHEQERVYEAWRKDHPVPPPKNQTSGTTVSGQAAGR